MDAEFFKPFVDGTLETLKVQCSMEARPGKPYFQPETEDVGPGIAAVIGVTADRFRATVTLCFPEPVFLRLMSNMLGETCSTITQELEDGVAELLNIIFGAAKRQINQKNGGVQMAIPTILRGTGIRARALTDGKVIVLPFLTAEGEEFQIQISFENRAEARGGVS
jgi:CheY-specific phosphatase CheX